MTERLVLPTEQTGVVLRQLATEADDEAYFAAVEANRDHLSQFGDTTAQKYQSLEDVRKARLEAGDKIRMGIWAHDDFVGTVNASPVGMDAEIGYWLDSRYLGHGYATSATKALGAYAAERFAKVFASVDGDNLKSLWVLERAGFHQVANLRGQLIYELS